MVDVHALSALLRQLDFKVVSLLDLCKAEMQMAVNEFLLLLDKGVYGAVAPCGWLQPGGTWWFCAGGVLWGWLGKKRAPAGQGMSPALHLRQVCSTTPGTAMKILATASWCPSTRPAPTPRHTACACSGCCGACSSAAPASTSSCSTCAARGEPALGTSGHAGRSRHRGVHGCWFHGEQSWVSPLSHPDSLAVSGCPKASLPQLSWQMPRWVGSGARGSPESGCLGVGSGGAAGPSSAQQHFSRRNLNDDVIPQVGALQVTANIVFGYATWVLSPPPPAWAAGLSVPPSLRAGPGLSPHHSSAPTTAQPCWHLCLLPHVPAGSVLWVVGERQPRSLTGRGDARGAVRLSATLEAPLEHRGLG